MRQLRLLLALLVAASIALPVAGCGKKPRELEPPEGGQDFPRTYPTSK